MLQYIETSKIYPHPDNPRKDLGDLSELTESIKVNGILQNLTVVPKLGELTHQHNGEYTVVIGHRRLAAAKLAGLETVPCMVADMTSMQQIRTMLMENIQRTDLTAYEQAQGFQMMLDLGDTVSDISEKTGFSVTTVRHRIKLLELDSVKFKKASETGATLMDFMELEKIEDVEVRNNVLATIGTQNFKYELKKAIEKEKLEKDRAWLIAQLDTFAGRINDSKGFRYIRQYYGVNIRDFVKPDDAGHVKYYYKVETWGICLYGEPNEETLEQIARNEEYKKQKDKLVAKRAALDEISKRAFELRRDFVASISTAKAKRSISTILEYAVCAMLDDSFYNLDYPEIADVLNLKLDDNSDWEFKDIIEQLRKEPERYMLVMTYFVLETSESYYTWDCTHYQNESLDRIYDFLEKLGYEISDEELAMKDGTHELFVREAPNDAQS